MMNGSNWIPMKDAAKELKVSQYKLSQLVMSGQLETKENIRDKRAKLINLEQAKQVLGMA